MNFFVAIIRQAGPLSAVRIAQNKDRGGSLGYAFITFKHAASVPFTIKLLTGIHLYGRPLKLQTRTGSELDPPAALDNAAKYNRCNSMPDVTGSFRGGDDYTPTGSSRFTRQHSGYSADYSQSARDHAAPYTSRRNQFAESTFKGRGDRGRETTPQVEAMVSAQLQQLRYNPQAQVLNNMMMMMMPNVNMQGPPPPVYQPQQMNYQFQPYPNQNQHEPRDYNSRRRY